MAKQKPKFKAGQAFFHPGQNLFVQIESVANYDKGFLYTLKVFSHGKENASQFKRYYEDKVVDLLLPMRETKAMKVLYGQSNKSR